jgi:hypothetical protein
MPASVSSSRSGRGGSPVRPRIRYAGLKRNLVVIEFDNFGRFEVGTDGALVWEDSPLETKIRDGWDARESVRRFGVAQHAPWRSMFASARKVGRVPLDGVDHWHVGPYERLGETHTRIQEYLDEHGLTQRAAAWEEYWTDPGMEPDPAKWRTKVVWPVEPAGDE